MAALRSPRCLHFSLYYLIRPSCQTLFIVAEVAGYFVVVVMLWSSLCGLVVPSIPSSSRSVQRGRGDNQGTQLWRPDGALCCGWVIVIVVSCRFCVFVLLVVGWLRCRLSLRRWCTACEIHETIRSLSPPKAPVCRGRVRSLFYCRRALCKTNQYTMQLRHCCSVNCVDDRNRSIIHSEHDHQGAG